MTEVFKKRGKSCGMSEVFPKHPKKEQCDTNPDRAKLTVPHHYKTNHFILYEIAIPNKVNNNTLNKTHFRGILLNK